ncbi:hypothetical protein [Streptomyces sp. NBC_00388]|uniref:hypothetical protein n=1 Tax=Streptomyces sp. NBC_00388 TaxID=2975735 RepID=UPI002E1BE4A7
MSPRLSLRTAVLAAVAVGTVLVPSTAAFASDSPKPAAAKTEPSAAPADRSEAAARANAPRAVRPGTAPRGGVAAGDKPAPKARVATPVPKDRAAAAPAPRGGVAAGERPTGNSGTTPALIGSAAGAVLLAGAGTVVLRRRSTAQRNG